MQIPLNLHLYPSHLSSALVVIRKHNLNIVHYWFSVSPLIWFHSPTWNVENIFYLSIFTIFQLKNLNIAKRGSVKEINNKSPATAQHMTHGICVLDWNPFKLFKRFPLNLIWRSNTNYGCNTGFPLSLTINKYDSPGINWRGVKFVY